MRKRPFSPSRALRPAAALLLALSLAASARAQSGLADAYSRVEGGPSASPAALAATETLSILDAQRSGELAVEVRGTGDTTRVRFRLRNESGRRLNVVLPPGLVASAGVGQGFQSMGLGVPTDQPGRFGLFNPPAGEAPGFRSLPASRASEGLGLMPGESAELDVPAVCLNFGLPNPRQTHTFRLMAVEDYTPDARARKALRSLAILGTSQGVAQAVAWQVFNGLGFEQMSRQARQAVNPHEISVAARFVQALDASGSHELVDPAYFRNGRVLVRVRGEGSLDKVALRLGSELQGAPVFGLPVQVVDEAPSPVSPSTILLDVTLIGDAAGRVGGRVQVGHSSAAGDWERLGVAELGKAPSAGDLTGADLADGLDRAVASAFVTISPTARSAGLTTLKVVNKLPFTAESVVVRAGRDAAAPRTTLDGLAVGPHRSALAPIEAATGVVERVIWNGL